MSRIHAIFDRMEAIKSEAKDLRSKKTLAEAKADDNGDTEALHYASVLKTLKAEYKRLDAESDLLHRKFYMIAASYNEQRHNGSHKPGFLSVLCKHADLIIEATDYVAWNDARVAKEASKNAETPASGDES